MCSVDDFGPYSYVFLCIGGGVKDVAGVRLVRVRVVGGYSVLVADGLLIGDSGDSLW